MTTPNEKTVEEKLSAETEAQLEEVMWQIKGDMHNLAGGYNPAFTDKAEKHIRKLLTSQALEEGARRERERNKLATKRSKKDLAKDNAWNDLGNTLRNGV